MDPSDQETLNQLKQLVAQSHVDVNGIANHAISVGVIFWLVIGAIVIATLYFRYQTRADRMKLIQALAERGQPIPPELFQSILGNAQPGPTDYIARGVPANYITRGVLLISIGLATILFFLAAVGAFSGTMDRGDFVAPLLGAFPLFLGLAYLGIGVYQRRHG